MKAIENIVNGVAFLAETIQNNEIKQDDGFYNRLIKRTKSTPAKIGLYSICIPYLGVCIALDKFGYFNDMI